MEITYNIIKNYDINKGHIDIFVSLLLKQKKIKGTKEQINQRIKNCNLICLILIENKTIGIGAIKKKTKSDFNKQKANLPNLEKEFNWELGYLYITPKYSGKGIGSHLVKLLINEYGETKLMASTELTENKAMVRILNNNGFKHYGNPWKSIIHSNYLGLFLRF